MSAFEIVARSQCRLPGRARWWRFGGGAELILGTLEQGLVEQGRPSSVLARDGLRAAGKLIESASAHEHRHPLQQDIATCAFDLIHFHSFDFHKYLPDGDIPMLATLHLPIDWYPTTIFHASMPRSLTLNCVSQSQAKSSPHSQQLPVISNGIRTADHFSRVPESYLLWLGRICPEKGVHLALAVADRLNAHLTVAVPSTSIRAISMISIARLNPSSMTNERTLALTILRGRVNSFPARNAF